jgi:hypothetical protein
MRLSPGLLFCKRETRGSAWLHCRQNQTLFPSTKFRPRFSSVHWESPGSSPLQTETGCCWLMPVILATWETEIGRFKDSLEKQFERSHLKTTRAKWTGGMAQARVLALQVQSPELKPQYHHQKKKKKKKRKADKERKGKWRGSALFHSQLWGPKLCFCCAPRCPLPSSPQTLPRSRTTPMSGLPAPSDGLVQTIWGCLRKVLEFNTVPHPERYRRYRQSTLGFPC